MTIRIEGEEYLPAAVAAERLGTTEMKILMLLRQKALCGRQLDELWVVSADSLAGYDRDAPPPAPSRCATPCSGSSCGCR